MAGLVYDFSGPFLAAAIITHPDGVRFPLWISQPGTLMGRVGKDLGKSADFSSAPWVSEATVRLQLSYIPIIKVTLQPPLREGMSILNSELIEWGRNLLQVQFGYTSGAPQGPVLSPVFEGLMLKPDIQLGTDMQITLNAQGGPGFSTTRQTQGLVTPAGVKWSRLEVIKKLAAGVNNSPPRKTTVGLTFTQTQAPKAWAKLHDEKDTYTQGPKTDWFEIYSLCTACLCWPMVVGDKIQIFAREERFSAKPSKTFAYYDFQVVADKGTKGTGGVIGPSVGVYPIIQATSPTSAIYLPGSIRGLKADFIDSETRKPATAKIDESTSKLPRVGGSKNDGSAGNPSAATPAPDAATGRGMNSMPSYEAQKGDTIAAGQLESEFARQTELMGIQLDIETVGIPDLMPGEPIRIAGCGERLDGIYCVFDVTHTIGRNGFSTNFECRSNTMHVLKEVMRLTNVNTQAAKDAEDADKVTAEAAEAYNMSSRHL